MTGVEIFGAFVGICFVVGVIFLAKKHRDRPSPGSGGRSRPGTRTK
jgi:hypothetical protein